MKKITLLAALLALLGFGSQAKAVNNYGMSFTPSISSSIIDDGGAQTYTNLVSGSRVGIYSGAADHTDTLTWSMTIPHYEYSVVDKVRVRYKPVITALDAAPDCSMYVVTHNNNGLGTTQTATEYNLTEGSGCVTTINTENLCTSTYSIPIRLKRGDAISVACTFNKSATGRVFIESVGVYGEGQ